MPEIRRAALCLTYVDVTSLLAPMRARQSSCCWLLLVALCGFVAAQAPRTIDSTRVDDTLPNVVFILFDDMGWGDLGCYGSANATPCIDGLALQGLRAEAFYVAQPVCSASRAAYLTGRLPHRLGVRGALFPDARNGLPDAALTFAEVLQSRGYATAVFGKWHLGHTASFHPSQHGFDEYCGIPYSHDMAPASPYAAGRFAPLPLWDGTRIARTDPPFEELTGIFTARACDFIRRKKDVPFCVYLPHPMPHTPLAASAAFRGSTGRGLYADVLAELDASVGAILTTLDECGVADNTLVMLASDNGPWLQMGTHSGSAGPLREGKGTTFDGGVRVPFIARWPGHIPEGTVCHTPFGAVDLCPTLAQIAGVQLDVEKLDGRSALPLLLNPTRADSPSDSYAFYYDGPKFRSLRRGAWKLHVPHESRSLEGVGKAGVDGMPGTYGTQQVGLELYKIESDVGERQQVQAAHPDVVRELQAVVAANLARDRALAQRIEHTWAGPQWCPSRLQDWSRVGTELRCTNAKLPFRTLHQLVTRVVANGALAEPLYFETQLRWSQGAAESACAGFIFGVGNEHIDVRISALVQQAPGLDGGMLAVLCADGSLQLLDFSTAIRAASRALPTDVRLSELTCLARTLPGVVPAALMKASSIRLRVKVTSEADGHFSVQCSAHYGAVEIAATTPVSLARSFIDGGYGLVAQHGGSEAFAFSGTKAFSQDKGWLHSERTHEFGPIFGSLHSIERTEAGAHLLRMSVQLAPLPAAAWGRFGLDLRVAKGDAWQEVALAVPEPVSNTLVFPAVSVPSSVGVEWRVRGTWLAEENMFWACERSGMLRAPPALDREARAVLLSCVNNMTVTGAWNHHGVWFPHQEIVQHVLAHDPDLVIFGGDQIYEGDVSAPERGEQALLDLQTRWMRFHWAFGDILRDRPAIVTPDDHDVYQGNVWGAGGFRTKLNLGTDPARTVKGPDAGGFVMGREFVNASYRMQTAHMPPTVVPTPLSSGVNPWTTRLVWGPFDCAILSDRLWKDSATVHVPAGDVRNGFFHALEFDPRNSDAPLARLLGAEQEAFLEQWATKRIEGSPARFVISQSPFVAAHTLPKGKTDDVVPSLPVLAPNEWPADDEPSADTDTNGWPMTARSRAVKLVQAAGALHLCGDQHLGTLIQYGIDGWRDGPFVFTSPSMANCWPRRWMPTKVPVPTDPAATRGCGDFTDAFGNRFSMMALANPQLTGIEPTALHDRAPGYGIIRLAATTRSISVEAWPRHANPAGAGVPYPGWPVRLN
ncbi:MAG: hypothetical protein EXS14_06380 [Planctomycetes bacterium]|nr:hypothetical protein [Planctomycetota bacterium]